MASKMSLLPLLCILFFLVKCNARTSSAFEKGSKAQGLHDLKLYLTRYGYLNYQPTPNHASPQNHQFDQELENALKSYQNFHNLKPTGSLDEATVSQMAKPRCGHPDIKADHQHNTKPLLFKSHYEITPCIYRWPSGKANLSYAFDSSFPTEYKPPVIRGFSTWACASNFTFYRVDDFEGSDMKIVMVSGEGTPFTGLGTLAVANIPTTGGTLSFNALYNWTAGPETVPDVFDVETVALHEIGHLLGLGHSQYGNAIMWPTIGSAFIKGLGPDDIEGLKVLYGDAPCIDPVPPPARESENLILGDTF